ncbi:aminoglycoside phosphotransferase family protein [Deinococcus rubellus]
MHPDETETSPALARRLMAAQFPQWAGLPLKRLRSSGTVNAIYRLGDDMVVRLPLIHWGKDDAVKEAYWLPRLAPLLPLAIPVPLAVGQPGGGYPFAWSIHRWLDGEEATLESVADESQLALDLAAFISALQETAPPKQTSTELLSAYGQDFLSRMDDFTRASTAACEGMFDTALAAHLWQDALMLPAWSGLPVLLHGDMQSGNLLAQQGRLSAVIDFGALGLGDPAVDLKVAWGMLTAAGRQTFRAALRVDDDTWARGRAWALAKGVQAVGYYRVSNPVFFERSLSAVTEVLGEYRQET